MFDIQMFGTNDTVVSSDYLNIITGFIDDDTRQIKVPNPKSDITVQEIEALDTWIVDNKIIIGDQAGADTTGINSATHIEEVKTRLDIS